MDKRLTDEQQHAVELAVKHRGNVKIEAFAGTGKTTTLKAIGQAMGSKKGLYLAFNKSIADEAARTFPRTVQCKTVHALAFREMGSIYKPRLKQRLTAQAIAHELNVTDWNGFQATALSQMAQQTVSRFCQGDADELARKHTPRDAIKSFEATGGVDAQSLEEVVMGIARQLWRRMEDPKGSIPVTHDFYLKKWALSRPHVSFDYLMLDEAQDANPLLLKIIDSLGIPVVFVGDQYQQIYSWRGAVNAMRRFQTDAVGRLTQSFRFGEAIAAVANEVLVDVLGSKVAIRGNPQIQSSVREIQAPRAVLCRTNAEAIAQLTIAIGQRRKAALQGGTDEISALVRGMDDLMQGHRPQQPELALFSEWEQLKLYAESEMGQDLQPVVKLVESYGARKLLSIFDQVSMNKEENSDVVISTVHKAKGREWTSVLLGSDFRGPEDKGYHSEEGNLLYVAATRGIECLDISGCDPIEQIRKRKKELADQTALASMPRIEPSALHPLSVFDDFWESREESHAAALSEGMPLADLLNQEESALGSFLSDAGLAKVPSDDGKPSASAAPVLTSKGKESARKQQLTGQKAQGASEFLQRAKREGKDNLLIEGAATDAWQTLGLALESEEGLNLWVDQYMSSDGRKRMLATLRQATYSQKVETKQIRVSESLYDDLSEAAAEEGLTMQELLTKLLALRSARVLHSSTQQLDA